MQKHAKPGFLSAATRDVTSFNLAHFSFSKASVVPSGKSRWVCRPSVIWKYAKSWPNGPKLHKSRLKKWLKTAKTRCFCRRFCSKLLQIADSELFPHPGANSFLQKLDRLCLNCWSVEPLGMKTSQAPRNDVDIHMDLLYITRIQLLLCIYRT